MISLMSIHYAMKLLQWLKRSDSVIPAENYFICWNELTLCTSLLLLFLKVNFSYVDQLYNMSFYQTKVNFALKF